jgi:hypothetical protein
MTTRVDILKEKFDNIQFPPQCPVCGQRNPDSTMNMRTYISVNQPLKEKIGEHWKLDIPVCTKHKRNIIVGRWFSFLLFIIMILLSMLILYGLWLVLGDQNWMISSVAFIAVISAAIFVNSKIYNPPLLLESFSYRLLFTFRNDQLAEEFARLNGIKEVHSAMNQNRRIKDEY